MFTPQFGIVCGYEHTILLGVSGDVWGIGANRRKQISDHPMEISNIKQMELSNIKQIACTNYTTFALTEEGEVKKIGSLGNIDLSSFQDIIYIACGDKLVACITSNLEVLTFESDVNYIQTNIPSPVVGLCNIKSVSCGANHSVFVNTEGRLFSNGSNSYGQLGLGDELKRDKVTEIQGIPEIDYVVSGSWFSIAFSINGDVFSWGYNRDGQLGLRNNNYNSPQLVEFNDCTIAAVSCGYYHSLFLDTEGNVYSCGRNRNGQLGLQDSAGPIEQATLNIPTKIQGLPPIVMLSHGGCHTFLLDANGEIWCFGNNSRSQLGMPSSEVKEQKTPVKLNSIMNDIEVRRASFCTAKSARK